MKIYPSFSKIEERQSLVDGDIPIAYVSVENREINMNVEKITQITDQGDITEPVYPYTPVQDTNEYLFDEAGTVADNTTFIEKVNGVNVIKAGIVKEFTPERFKASVTVKKNMDFDITKAVNLRIGVIESSMSSIAKNLVSITGDGGRRGMIPANMRINNEDTSIDSFYDFNESELDLLIIESHDGVHYAETNEVIDFEHFLHQHINVLIATNEMQDIFEKVSAQEIFDDEGFALDMQEPFNYVIQEPFCYKEEFITLDKITGYWYMNELLAKLRGTSNDIYQPRYLFVDNQPVGAIENVGNAFLLFSEKGIFEAALANRQFISEMLLYIYYRGYKNIQTETNWIADEPISMLYSPKNYYMDNQSVINIVKLLTKVDPYITAFTIHGVETDNSNVKYLSRTLEGNLRFAKLSPTDPTRQKGTTSIYTRNGSIVHYKEKLYRRETSYNYRVQEMASTYEVTIDAIKSSKYSLDTMAQVANVPKQNGTYLICAKPMMKELFILRQADFSDDYIPLLRLDVVEKNTRKLFDAFVPGGGLPVQYDDDYNYLDIASIEGRPYRISSGVVIKLPRQLEEYDKEIRSEIEKHQSSGEIIKIKYE